MAHTQESPRQYYYRKQDKYNNWTAWELVDVEIEGEHAMPVIFKNELYIFWLHEESEVYGTVDESKEMPKIHLAWTKQEKNAWKSKSVSKKGVSIANFYSPNLSLYIYTNNNSELELILLFKSFSTDEYPNFYINQLNDLRMSGDDYICYQEWGDFLYNFNKIIGSSGNEPYSYDEFYNYMYLIREDQLRFAVENAYHNAWTSCNESGEDCAESTCHISKQLINEFISKSIDFIETISYTPISKFTFSKLNVIHSYIENTYFRLNSLDSIKEYGKHIYSGNKSFNIVAKGNVATHAFEDVSIMTLQNIDVKVLLNIQESLYAILPHQHIFYKSQSPFFIEDNERTYLCKPFTVGDCTASNNTTATDKTAGNVSSFDTEISSYVETYQTNALNSLIKDAIPENETNLDKSDYISNTSSSYFSPAVQQTDDNKDTKTYAALPQCDKKYRFYGFYHPYSKKFIEIISKYGVDALLDPRNIDELNDFVRQVAEEEPNTSDKYIFEEQYSPTEEVSGPFPKETISFNSSDAYGFYNWELFYHIPMYVATQLSANQKFEDAQKWYHYIFNPTVSGTENERYWRIKPFVELYNSGLQTIQELMIEINQSWVINTQVKQWEDNPFEPHYLARLRPVAYMKNTMQKYLDNLIAWGDNLFRRDTVEYINEAAQIYILASKILGRRPVKIDRGTPEALNFLEMGNNIDETGNIMVELENIFGNNVGVPNDIIDNAIENLRGELDYTEMRTNTMGAIDTILYFCIPDNPQMTSYWDTVADRLFKIRYCKNIEGVERHLDLFEPPIDPALLVKAIAGGSNLSSILSGINNPPPHYRFRYMLQKALEFTNDIKSLGQTLLSALEKQDAETLSLLRSNHEISITEAATHIKEKNIEEAKANIKALEQSVTNALYRQNYYDSKEYVNANEKLQLNNTEKANHYNNRAQSSRLLGSILGLLPQIGLNGLMPTFQFGGNHLVNISNIVAQIAENNANKLLREGSLAAIKGGYDRRRDDWSFQAKTAENEIKQIEKQKLASEIRLAVAEKDLENHKLQIQNSKEAYAFMQDKFTNTELYSWMSKKITSFYFKAYQNAYDLAKQAEEAMRFELGDDKVKFIDNASWDDARKGLLAGEILHHQIRQMELAYIEQNKREYEVTKHISLAMLNPNALLSFQSEGKCDFDIPEILFDLDFPGHYFRRIKSVSITIPAVTGPYTNINCKLSLLNCKTRISSSLIDGNYANTGSEDERFKDNNAFKSVATGSGRNDSGVFELNFNDERYLPFEGRGAISSWQLELPKEYRQFDYGTISDVILTINYTAKEGGIADTVTTEINNMINDISEGQTWSRFFSLKSEFSDNLFELIKENEGEGLNELSSTIMLTQNLFPYFFKGKNIKVERATLVVKTKNENDEISNDGTGSVSAQLNGNSSIFSDEDWDNGYYSAEYSFNDDFEITQNGTELPVTLINAKTEVINDIILVLEYSVSQESQTS